MDQHRSLKRPVFLIYLSPFLALLGFIALGLFIWLLSVLFG
jgi:hypothetical protein